MKTLRPITAQICSSFFIAGFSLATSAIVSHKLSLEERTDYGIIFVTIGQVLLFAGMGLPGAFNVLGITKTPKLMSNAFVRLVGKNLFAFTIVSFALLFYYRISLATDIYATLSTLLLFLVQLMFNVLQKTVKTEFFAVLRLIPTFVFCLVIILATNGNDYSLSSITFSWLVCIFCIFLSYLKISSHYRKATYTVEQSPEEIRQFARNGFIAHVNFQDLVKIDYIVIPAIGSVIYSATYFCFIGLSQWPKVLIDGLCTGLMPRYQLGNLELNLRKTRRIALTLVVTIALSLSALYDPLSLIVAKIVGPNYHENVQLFFIWSICASLIYSRRICLDPLRASDSESGRKASKIEVRAGLIGSLYLPVLFLSQDLTVLATFQTALALGAFVYVLFMSRGITIDE